MPEYYKPPSLIYDYFNNIEEECPIRGTVVGNYLVAEILPRPPPVLSDMHYQNMTKHGSLYSCWVAYSILADRIFKFCSLLDMFLIYVFGFAISVSASSQSSLSVYVHAKIYK